MALSAERVVIAGAGIAGLALARGLGNAGMKCTVLEQTKTFGQVGHPIGITPNGARILQHLGVYENVVKMSQPVTRRITQEWHTGKVLTDFEVPAPLAGGLPQLQFVQRSDLHNVLLDSLDPAYVDVQNFRKVISVTSGDRVGVVRYAGPNGQAETTGDVVVGADGFSSVTRDYVTRSKEQHVSYTGLNWVGGMSDIVEGTVPEGVLFSLRSPPGTPFTLLTYFNMGRAPSGEDSVHWSIFTRRGGELLEGWHHNPWAGGEDCRFCNRKSLCEGSVCPALLELVPGIFPDYAKFVSDSNSVLATGLNSRPTALSWARGRTAIIGDAAHPFVPTMHQGANQALEDAGALCCAVRDHRPEMGTEASTEKVLAEFARRRIARNMRVEETSTAILRWNEAETEEQRKKEFKNVDFYTSGLSWLYDHCAWTGDDVKPSWAHPEAYYGVHTHRLK